LKINRSKKSLTLSEPGLTPLIKTSFIVGVNGDRLIYFSYTVELVVLETLVNFFFMIFSGELLKRLVI
jgi:hypothetical protein